ncbi:MAG: sulfatase-like hydrolase/transferase [Rubripirellula sp.]|nr:sulfatase-like hydrolase/transferase [Rubripirellula sp.]
MFLFALLAAVGIAAEAEVEQKPNVVILFTDDQGTLDVNCYGSTDLKTPNLDKLAASGIRFTQAYAHVVCCPSRAALLTGRHPQRGGINHWTQGDRHGSDQSNSNMAATEITLGERLNSAGYQTAYFGKWHLGAKLGHGPLDQGFENYFGHLSGFIDNYRHYFLHGRGYHDLYDGKVEIFRPEQYYPDMLIEKVVDYIETEREQPFFVTVAFNLPHYPEQPIGKYKDAYPDMAMPRQSYARVISSVDDHIGRVLDALERTGKRTNTIVVMMSDNGHSTENSQGIRVSDHTSGYPAGHYYLANGGGGNTGKWIGHKGQFLEGGIRVPAMISFPGKIPAGETRDQIITVMDWFPTILDLCDIQTTADEPRIDGRSLISVIEKKTANSPHQVLHFAWANGWAVRKGEWKLIRSKGSSNATTLRRLSDDQPEAKDYSGEHPSLVAELTALHQAWQNDVQPN